MTDREAPHGRVLALDSYTMLNGTLRLPATLETDGRSRNLSYAFITIGPITTITRSQDLEAVEEQAPGAPHQSVDFAQIKWKSTRAGQPNTTVCVGGQTRNLEGWMKTSSFGSDRSFTATDFCEPLRWTQTGGRWQCTQAAQRKVICVLHSFLGMNGTCLKIPPEALALTDALVLTSLFVLHGQGDWKHEWRRYRRDTNHAWSSSSLDLDLDLSSPTITPPRSAAPSRPSSPPPPPAPEHPTFSLQLVLSTRNMLNGVLSLNGDPVYVISTTGPRTSLSKYATSGRQVTLEEFASVDWNTQLVTGKNKSAITIGGQTKFIDEVLYTQMFAKSPRRFGFPNFLQWVTWVDTPTTLSKQCYSNPGQKHLATWQQRRALSTTSMRATNASIQFTEEGLQYMNTVVLTALLSECGPHDWRYPGRVTEYGEQQPSANAIGQIPVVVVEGDGLFRNQEDGEDGQPARWAIRTDSRPAGRWRARVRTGATALVGRERSRTSSGGSPTPSYPTPSDGGRPSTIGRRNSSVSTASTTATITTMEERSVPPPPYEPRFDLFRRRIGPVVRAT